MIISTVVMLCLTFSAQAAKSIGLLKNPLKTLTTDGCPYNVSLPVTMTAAEDYTINKLPFR